VLEALKPNSITLAGSKPVRSWSQTGSKLVGDQLRTSFEPASVMEFGFYRRPVAVVPAWTRAHVARLIVRRSVVHVAFRRIGAEVVLTGNATPLSANLTSC